MDLKLKYVRDEEGNRRLTIPEDRRAAAIAFVEETAQRPPAEIEAVVRDGHESLLAALDGISESQASFKPGPDDWSVLELMSHVVSTKRIVALLAAALAEGKLPPGINADSELESRQDGVTIMHFETLESARETAESAHADMLKFIRTISDATNTELRFRHFVFGAFNSREWAVFQRVHDDNHAPQIFDIKASAGYPGA